MSNNVQEMLNLLGTIKEAEWSKALENDYDYVIYLYRQNNKYLYRVILSPFSILVYRDKYPGSRDRAHYKDFIIKFCFNPLWPSTWPILRLWIRVNQDYRNRDATAKKSLQTMRDEQRANDWAEFQRLMKEGDRWAKKDEIRCSRPEIT